jgi:hypothetical protein
MKEAAAAAIYETCNQLLGLSGGTVNCQLMSGWEKGLSKTITFLRVPHMVLCFVLVCWPLARFLTQDPIRALSAALAAKFNISHCKWQHV